MHASALLVTAPASLPARVVQVSMNCATLLAVHASLGAMLTPLQGLGHCIGVKLCGNEHTQAGQVDFCVIM